jgi:hypothetical protein
MLHLWVRKCAHTQESGYGSLSSAGAPKHLDMAAQQGPHRGQQSIHSQGTAPGDRASRDLAAACPPPLPSTDQPRVGTRGHQYAACACCWIAAAQWHTNGPRLLGSAGQPRGPGAHRIQHSSPPKSTQSLHGWVLPDDTQPYLWQQHTASLPLPSLTLCTVPAEPATATTTCCMRQPCAARPGATTTLQRHCPTPRGGASNGRVAGSQAHQPAVVAADRARIRQANWRMQCSRNWSTHSSCSHSRAAVRQGHPRKGAAAEPAHAFLYVWHTGSA